MNEKNIFSEYAPKYASFRPDYPEAMFEYFASIVSNKQLALDCGTGNGQTAYKLANYFEQVIGLDTSREQLDSAIKRKNILYQEGSAEETKLKNNSVGLICVAQALHWFDLKKFYKEVDRILKDKGVLAVWCYSMTEVNEAIDEIVKKIYEKITHNQLSSQAKMVKENYKTIQLPFKPVDTPTFYIEKQWDFSQFLSYIHTWPSMFSYVKEIGIEPLIPLFEELHQAWHDRFKERLIRWRIHLFVSIK